MRTPPIARRLRRAAWIAGLALLAAPAAAERAGPFLYTDENGSTHMVQRFDEVPARHRPSVRSLGASPDATKGVEYQSRVSTMTKRRAAQARERTKALAGKVPERRRDPVLFYTASWCGACDRVRTHLRKRGIPYEERSVDEPAILRELSEKIGAAQVPVVEREGERVIGYQPGAIDALAR